MESQPCPESQRNQNINFDQSPLSTTKQKEDKSLGSKQIISDRKHLYEQANGEGPNRDHGLSDEREMKVEVGYQIDGENRNEPWSHETKVWIRCDVHDTGIGIPGTLTRVSLISQCIVDQFPLPTFHVLGICYIIKKSLCATVIVHLQFIHLMSQKMPCPIYLRNTCKLVQILLGNMVGQD